MFHIYTYKHVIYIHPHTYICMYVHNIYIIHNISIKWLTSFLKITCLTIGTKFSLPYACIIMDHIETEFLKTQDIKPWFWKRFIYDIFCMWTESEISP